MARRFYTVFVLPHARARFRKIHFSRNFFFAIALVLLLFVAGGALTPHLLLKVDSLSQTVERLRAENRMLREENLVFEASLAEMGDSLNSVEEQARKLAREVGLEHVPSPDAAGGGGGAVLVDRGVQAMLNEELAAMRSRTHVLERSLEEIEKGWEVRAELLASTPSIMPVQGFFSDGFGWRNDPLDGRREFHQGLDIVAPLGTTVRASADGVVTRSGREAGYGKMVHISHGFGYASRYGHLSEILVKPGQNVRRGEILGRVGSTGRSTGPHLHYEVFKDGRRTNPWRYLGRKK